MIPNQSKSTDILATEAILPKDIRGVLGDTRPRHKAVAWTRISSLGAPRLFLQYVHNVAPAEFIAAQHFGGRLHRRYRLQPGSSRTGGGERLKRFGMAGFL